MDISNKYYDLRAKAVTAYQEQKKVIEARNNLENNDLGVKTRAAFIEWFDMEPDSVDGNLVVFGDVRLSYAPESWHSDYGRQNAGWHVVGECPRCHQVVRSPWCSDLESIGGYLIEFRSDYGHFCELTLTVTEDETVEDRLVSLLREIIGQELAERMEGA